jgi:uncharacterized membrane protein YjgN (DUF898 family)
MIFLKMTAALFFGLLTAFAAVIVGTTINGLYGFWGMAVTFVAGLCLWFIIAKSLQSRQTETNHHESYDQPRHVALRSTDIVRRD